VTPASAYLIQYGRLGFVGRFRSASPLTRGERVVLRGPRGVELGEVLVSPNDRVTSHHDDGEILRIATDADARESARLDAIAQELLDAAAATAADLGLPLAFVDVEVMLDSAVILHALPWEECDATPLLDDLAARFGFPIRLLDLSRAVVPGEEQEHGGCGEPGCGSESGGGCSTGGCSSGSCSRGAAKSADELTEYFADLRRKMEAAGIARTPLN
jgi:cell fate regulator YaaT (PSP1 superfamily)